MRVWFQFYFPSFYYAWLCRWRVYYGDKNDELVFRNTYTSAWHPKQLRFNQQRNGITKIFSKQKNWCWHHARHLVTVNFIFLLIFFKRQVFSNKFLSKLWYPLFTTLITSHLSIRKVTLTMLYSIYTLRHEFIIYFLKWK